MIRKLDYRVKKRVAEGGHKIEEKVIERRYNSGISNLFNLYVSKVDSLLIYDNSNIESELNAEKELNGEFVIHQPEKYGVIDHPKTEYIDQSFSSA